MPANHLYFAYGSNLHIEQMQRRCPGSRPIGRATLQDHRLVFPRPCDTWQGGVAGVEPAASSHVEGALYEITDDDLEKLDRYEGIAEGEYTRGLVAVTLPDGRVVRDVITYYAVIDGDGDHPPSRRYLEAILTGAAQHQLTPAWIDYLQSIQTRD